MGLGEVSLGAVWCRQSWSGRYGIMRRATAGLCGARNGEMRLGLAGVSWSGTAGLVWRSRFGQAWSGGVEQGGLRWRKAGQVVQGAEGQAVQGGAG